jgi:hypothetical protein
VTHIICAEEESSNYFSQYQTAEKLNIPFLSEKFLVEVVENNPGGRNTDINKFKLVSFSLSFGEMSQESATASIIV